MLVASGLLFITLFEKVKNVALVMLNFMMQHVGGEKRKSHTPPTVDKSYLIFPIYFPLSKGYVNTLSTFSLFFFK